MIFWFFHTWEASLEKDISVEGIIGKVLGVATRAQGRWLLAILHAWPGCLAFTRSGSHSCFLALRFLVSPVQCTSAVCFPFCCCLHPVSSCILSFYLNRLPLLFHLYVIGIVFGLTPLLLLWLVFYTVRFISLKMHP